MPVNACTPVYYCVHAFTRMYTRVHGVSPLTNIMETHVKPMSNKCIPHLSALDYICPPMVSSADAWGVHLCKRVYIRVKLSHLLDVAHGCPSRPRSRRAGLKLVLSERRFDDCKRVSDTVGYGYLDVSTVGIFEGYVLRDRVCGTSRQPLVGTLTGSGRLTTEMTTTAVAVATTVHCGYGLVKGWMQGDEEATDVERFLDAGCTHEYKRIQRPSRVQARVPALSLTNRSLVSVVCGLGLSLNTSRCRAERFSERRRKTSRKNLCCVENEHCRDRPRKKVGVIRSRKQQRNAYIWVTKCMATSTGCLTMMEPGVPKAPATRYGAVLAVKLPRWMNFVNVPSGAQCMAPQRRPPLLNTAATFLCNTQLYYEVELGIIGVVKAEGLLNTGQDVFEHFLETGTVNNGIEVEERHGVVCSAIKTISQLMNASKDLRLHKAGSDDD
ncbi:hypothetical protein ARMGADRAFT_1061548 [Armillaria gallica]|uniref:Uncharacterized protein n=1 Tax=Armillaria gallica TaxID=47427 RepID=A0A2H3DPJ3_ARMGA|nr:hypothetical protein ARMGADRAFT_1061548 [Armillaria gallica]